MASEPVCPTPAMLGTLEHHVPSQAEPTPTPQYTYTYTQAFTSRAPHLTPQYTHTHTFTSRVHIRPTVHTHTHTGLGPQTCLHRALQGSPLCPHQGRSPRRGFLQEGHTAHSGATCPPGVGVLLSRPNQFNAACSRRVTSAGPAGFCTPSPPPPPPGESLGLVLTLER